MRRARLGAAFGGIAISLAGHASAADPAPPVAPPPPVPAASQRPAGTVRLNVRPYRTTPNVKLQVGDAQDRWAFVCNAPCAADVVPGTALRVVIGDAEEGHEFAMEGNPGNEMDLEVRPASKGPLAGGIVMVSIGGLTALIGGVLLAAAASSNRNNIDELVTPAWITFAIGAGLTLGGIMAIVTRSKEPRITRNEHAPSQSSRPGV